MVHRPLNATFHSAHHPVSSWHMDDLLHGIDEGRLGDRVFNLRDLSDHGDLMLSPITWTNPLCQWCQGTSVATSPQPSRLQLQLQPLFVYDTSPGGGRQRGKKAQDSLNVADRCCSARTPACATSGGNQACAGDAQETACSNVPKNNGKGGEASKWRFTVDLKDCSDVNVSTEGDILTVEGNGFNSDCNYQKSVRYVTRLPSHVRQDTLTQKFNNGRFTVVSKAVAKDAAVPVQVQKQQEAPTAEKKQ